MGIIKAVLFDMDGVLIDAKDWHFEALNKALAEFGYHIPAKTHNSTYDGLPTSRKLELLTSLEGLPTEFYAQINKLKQGYTEEICKRRCIPSREHIQTLIGLKSAGYKLAVCSNSVKRSVALMMRLSKLEDYLDLQLSNEDVMRPKPAPEIYLTAAERLGVKTSQCLVIEDHEIGVKAAKLSGAHVMQVQSVEDVTYNAISEVIANVCNLNHSESGNQQ